MRWSSLLLVLLVGCAAPGGFALDERWRPLERVVLDRGVRDGWAQTLVPNVYCADPASLRPNHVAAAALLVHERFHAQRQLDFGVTAWVNAYRNDAAFRTTEELAGWHVQLQYLQDHGVEFDPLDVAEKLLSYDPKLQLDYTTAVFWARHEQRR